MKSRFYLTGLLLLMKSLSLSAQAPDAQMDELYEFRITGWNLDIPDLFYEVNGKSIPVPVYRRTLGKVHKYAARTPALELFSTESIGGVLTKVPLLRVTLNPPPQKNLIVVWKEKRGKIDSTVLSDDPVTPAPGNVRFVNIGGQDLLLKCNHLAPFQLGAGSSRIVEPESGGVGVGVKIAQMKKGVDAWELALMNGISIEPNERVTAFIADPRRLAPPPEEDGKPEKPVTDKLALFIIRDSVQQQP